MDKQTILLTAMLLLAMAKIGRNDVTDFPNDYIYCCLFDSESSKDACGWTASLDSTPWTWSTYSSPVRPPPGFAALQNQFVWLQGVPSGSPSTISSPMNLKIHPSDEISVTTFIYFASSNPGSMTMTIKDLDSSKSQTIALTNNGFGWMENKIICDADGSGIKCCEKYPCNGQVKIQGTITDSFDLLAFDIFEINSGCCDYGVFICRRTDTFADSVHNKRNPK